MSDVHALVAAAAETRTCRVCGPLLQASAQRPCFGSMHEAAREKAQLTQLAQRRLLWHVAGGADQ